MLFKKAGIPGVLILTVLVSLPQGAQGKPSLGLDGIGNGGNVGIACQGLCFARSLTTSHPNDLIIVVADCVGDSPGIGCLAAKVAITDSSGLSYTERASYADPNDFKIWELYAVTRSTLSSDHITITWSDMNGMGSMEVFAVHGYRREHFDLPAPVLVSSGSCSSFNYAKCSAALETFGRDFVFTNLAEPDIASCSLSPGWTSMYANGYSETDYLVLSAPNPNVQFTCTALEVRSPILMDAILLQPA